MAVPSIREILLRVTSDSDDAKTDLTELGAELNTLDAMEAEAALDIDTSAAERSLDDIRADLARFAREESESTAGLDTAKAREQLDALEIKLLDFDKSKFDATADVDITKAMAKIALLRAELAKLDTDFGPAGTKGLDQLGAASARALTQIANLSDETGRLGTSVDRVDRRGNILTRTLGNMKTRVTDLASSFGDFLTGSVDRFIRRGAVLSGVLTPMIGTLGELLGSATLAAGGLGALAVAAGGGLVTSIGFAFIAFKRFQQQADKAGTAAHHVQQAVDALKQPFNDLLPAADPVLQAIAKGLRGVGGVLEEIKPAIEAFGRDAGHAMGQFFDQLTSPRMAAAFSDLIRLSGTALKPIAQIMGSLLELATNLARAAMPALVKIFESWAESLKGLAQGSRNVADLRGHVDGLVKQLAAWWDLIGSIAKAWFAFSDAMAGPAKQMLGFFTDAADALASWADSKHGREEIKQFFKDTQPLAKEMFGLIGDLVKLFISFGQTVAPALKPVVEVIRSVVQWLDRLFDSIREMEPGPLKTVVTALLAFGPVVGIFKALKFVLGGVLGPLARLAGFVFAPVARGVIALGSALLSRLLPAVIAVAPELAILAAGVVSFYEGIKAGHKLAETFTKTLPEAEQLQKIGETARSVGENVDKALGIVAVAALKDFAKAGKDAVDSVVTSLKDGGPKAKKSAADLAHGALGAVKALTGDFGGAGREWIEALAGGQRSREGAAKNAADDVGRGAHQAIDGWSGNFHDSGEEHGDRYAGGLGGKEGAARNSGNAVGRAAKQAIADLAADFNTEGGQHGDRYAGGLTSKEGAAGNAGRGLGNAAKAAFAGVDYKGAGSSAGDSFAAGLKAVQQSLVAAGIAVGTAIGLAMSKSAQDNFHMPSAGGGSGGGGKRTSGKVATDGTTATLPPATSSSTVNNWQLNVTTPGGSAPDANHFLAQLTAAARLRGGF